MSLAPGEACLSEFRRIRRAWLDLHWLSPSLTWSPDPETELRQKSFPELNQKCKLYAKTAKCEQIEQTDWLSRTKLALYILPE